MNFSHTELFLLRNEKIEKGNWFEADFHHEEVTDMKGKSMLCAFQLVWNFLLFTLSIIKTKAKKYFV